LWPAAQRLRLMAGSAVVPVSTTGIQSQCSSTVTAARSTDGSARSTCVTFDQNHSEE
jgi:hypothetical protein